VELRRALLLFAIVLGLAAIATSISRPPERRERAQEPQASAPVPSPRPGSSGSREIVFTPAARPPTERLEAGTPATVVVEVVESGQVEIEGLGLSGFAEPLTPARFDVLASREGSHRVRFRPAGTDEAQTAGTLEVGPPAAAR
jgi:hypothetical protein